MARSHEGNDAGTIVQEIEIAAPTNVVWKALTDADQLVRWFPLEAEFGQGKGGSVRLTWGGFTEESTIQVWEPEKQLQLLEKAPFSVPSLEPTQLRASQRVVDYQLTPTGTKTMLRVTHSGFTPTSTKSNLTAAALDQVPETLELSPLALRSVVASCWQFQLTALGDYVENHLNQTRTVSWVRQPIQSSFEEAWRRLSAPAATGSSFQGLLHAQGATPNAAFKSSLTGLQSGDRYSFQTATGDTFTGTVLTYKANKQFAGTVENLNGIVRILLSYTLGRPDVSVWLARYSGVADLATTQQWHKLFESRWATALANHLI